MLSSVVAPQPVGDDERSLLARVIAGDRAAARVLYDAHAGRVHALAYRICRDPDLAADLTQDVFIKVFRSLEQFRGDSAFTTWLHRVAVTTCINGLRSANRHRHRETDLEEETERLVVVDSRELAPDVREAVHQAIDALPEHLRIALIMHVFEGYSHTEIGTVLGIAEGTSKRRVFDARARLRSALADHVEDLH